HLLGAVAPVQFIPASFPALSELYDQLLRFVPLSTSSLIRHSGMGKPAAEKNHHKRPANLAKRTCHNSPAFFPKISGLEYRRDIQALLVGFLPSIAANVRYWYI